MNDRLTTIWSREPRWSVAVEPDEPWRAESAAAQALELESAGFSRLGVIEDGTQGLLSKEDRLLLTVFLGDDGRIWAASYNLGQEIVEFETEFVDGHVIGTGNNEVAGWLAWPPSLDVRHGPFTTPVAELLESQRRRVSSYLSQTPGAEVRPCRSLDDVLASQLRQHHVKRAFRHAVGLLTSEEWQRIARHSRLSPWATAAVYREFRRLVEDAKRGSTL